jgi:hypothetical protein
LRKINHLDLIGFPLARVRGETDDRPGAAATNGATEQHPILTLAAAPPIVAI